MEKRREFIKKAIVGAGALAASGSLLAKECLPTLTPPQTEGPFYPDFDIKESDADLVFMKGKTKRARGEVVILEGKVQDQYCKAVKDVIVEIWQACDTGKYNHRSDPNTAALDPNFQYYAKVRTDKDGRFKIRTIIPGAYPATSTWKRPPHLHFKFSLRGYEELTTQTYFKGHSLNKKDRILQSLSKKERENVIIEYKDTKPCRGIPQKKGEFLVTLNKY